jgi:Mn-dependent DtxR family transcriptional regulator/Fe2+ transport system protein FeoA
MLNYFGGFVMLSHTAEDYLETIYLLSVRIGKVKTTDIANEFGIKTPSVISALKNLRQKGYLTYQSYGYVELSKKGMEKALNIYERHKLVFRLLHFVFGVNEDTASKDTCGLEHYISDETFFALKDFFDFLNEEKVNGNDIVQRFGSFRENLKKRESLTDNTFVLDKAKVGEKYRISKLTGTKEMKRRFLNMGIIPGEKIVVKQRGPFGSPMEIAIQGYSLTLRKNEINAIEVEEL